MKYLFSAALLSVALFTLAVTGCNTNSPESGAPRPDGSPTASQDGQSADPHAGHDHDMHAANGDSTDLPANVQEALADLSPEDAAAVKAQRTCPVSGELLGSMGEPIKVDVQGRAVWICCDGCRQDLLDNPDQYLTKLDQQSGS